MTGDRVAEIRARLDAATSGPWFVASGVTIKAPFDVGQEHIARASWPFDAELIANAPTDLQALLAENARLRAQLDAARKVADKWQRHGWLEVEHEREQGWVGAARQAARDFRSALNQGGETNDE